MCKDFKSIPKCTASQTSHECDLWEFRITFLSFSVFPNPSGQIEFLHSVNIQCQEKVCIHFTEIFLMILETIRSKGLCLRLCFVHTHIQKRCLLMNFFTKECFFYSSFIYFYDFTLILKYGKQSQKSE